MNLGFLDWRDVQLTQDRTFVIQLGPEPANGRRNYIQLKPDARYVLIRNTRSDWRQIPIALKVSRLDPPTARARSLEEMANRAALYTVDDIPATYWWVSMMHSPPVNTLSPPSGENIIVGGLENRKMSFGNIHLGDDEAYIITVGTGGAKYRGLLVMDYWNHSIGASKQTSSLSDTQSTPNSDGTYTYVVSTTDPGVHNWLATGGLHDMTVLQRWHLFPRPEAKVEGPWIKSQLVKVADLRKSLPPSTRFVTAAERRSQLAERACQFSLGFVDR